MKRYFIVEIEDDPRAMASGIRQRLTAYNCTRVREMTEVHFEARDGSTIHSDTEMMDLDRQTVSAYVDQWPERGR